MGDSAPTTALPLPTSPSRPMGPKPLTPPAPPTPLVPPATASAPVPGAALPAADQYDGGSALLRLLVGGMLVGADELRDRLRRWDERAIAADAAGTAPLGAASRPASGSVRRALVGAAFDAETRMRQRFATTLARVGRIADDATLVYTRLAFAARGTPLDAVRRRLDELLFLALTTVDRWTEQGQSEEQRSRLLAEQAAVGVIDELLDYMARNPEVRKLIEQQGTSMAESAVGEARERAASADQWIEQIAHNLLHRPPREQRANQAKGAGTTPPSATLQADAVATTASLPARAEKAHRPPAVQAPPSGDSGS